MKRILGISGCKTAGKSTLADYLVTNASRLFPGRTVRVLGFADALKEICHHVLDIPREVLFGGESVKGAALAGKSYSARDVLKIVGGVFIDFDPLCWTRLGMARAERLGSDLTIFADVRYPREVQAIRAVGGSVIRLTRDLHHDPHPSERALDGFVFDAYIDNRELTKEQTHTQALTVLAKLWGWPIFKGG